MADVTVKLNYSGVGELLKSQEVADYLGDLAGTRAGRCGTGYASDVKRLGTRVVASVYTDDYEAVLDNQRNNTLLKAVNAHD